MRANIAVALAVIIAGAVIGFFWPIASNRRAAICADIARNDKWMERQCLGSDEIQYMLDQAELFCSTHADDHHCIDAQKEALVRMVRIGEDRPLETNNKFPQCAGSGRDAQGRTDFRKVASCLESETRE
jgi:hypothetical protein